MTCQVIYSWQAIVQGPETGIEKSNLAIVVAFSPVPPASKERTLHYDVNMW